MKKYLLALALMVPVAAGAETIIFGDNPVDEVSIYLENGVEVNIDQDVNYGSDYHNVRFRDMYDRYFPLTSITISYQGRNFVLVSDAMHKTYYNSNDTKEIYEAIMSGDAVLRARRTRLDQCPVAIDGKSSVICAYNLSKNLQKPYHVGVVRIDKNKVR